MGLSPGSLCYGLILPAWAKITLGLGRHAGVPDPLSHLILISLFANPAVAAIKIGQWRLGEAT